MTTYTMMNDRATTIYLTFGQGTTESSTYTGQDAETRYLIWNPPTE